MIGALVGCVLAAAPASNIKLAAPGLSYVNVDEKVGGFLNEHLAQRMAEGGLSVITPSEIAQLVGFERQKELLGCSDQAASCLAELGGALGVDGLVTGSVARLGKTFRVNLKIIAANDGRALALSSFASANYDELLEDLEKSAVTLAADVKKALRPGQAITQTTPGQKESAIAAVTPEAQLQPAPSDEVKGSSPWWIPAAAGGALLAGGGVLFGMSRGVEAKLRNGDASGITDADDLQRTVNQGKTYELSGIGLMGAGVVGLGVAAGMALFGAGDGEGKTEVALMPTAQGAAITAAGSF